MCEEHSPAQPAAGHAAEARAAARSVDAVELIREVVAETAADGLREIIPSTMGEPLLYEGFEEIIDLCHEYGVKLNLTTNGTFPAAARGRGRSASCPVTSDVKISWNGATAETHEAIMVGTRWEEVLANARTFIAVRDAHAAAGGNRCRVTFQLTFLESNVGELADIVRLARGARRRSREGPPPLGALRRDRTASRCDAAPRPSPLERRRHRGARRGGGARRAAREHLLARRTGFPRPRAQRRVPVPRSGGLGER
jgi:pyruvate-formate lyase-activating enzyme